MEDKPEANDHRGNPQQEPPQSPREEVSGIPEPAPLFNDEATQRQQAHARQQRGPTMPGPPKRERDRYRTATIVLSILTLAVLGFNAYLVIKAHELTRNGLRAWVGPARIEGASNDALDLGAKVCVGNFGKSPALRLTQRLNNRLLPREEAFAADYSNAKSSSVGVLWPGTEQIGFFPSHAWKQGEIDALRSRRSVLYRYGEVTYYDVFDRPHRTTFADRLIYRDSRPTGWAWQVNDTYNDAN